MIQGMTVFLVRVKSFSAPRNLAEYRGFLIFVWIPQKQKNLVKLRL